jgi:hypothetical protein
MSGRLHVCVYCDDALAAYAAGDAVATIGRTLAVHPASIRLALRHHGIIAEARWPRHQCTARCAAITAIYNADHQSLDAIGQRFGLTRERVRQILRSHGVAPRKPRTYRVHTCTVICFALQAVGSPVPITAFARARGWAPFNVRRRARLHDIPIDRRGPGHTCRARCERLRAYLTVHPGVTVYRAARVLGLPVGWVGNVFLAWHRAEGWPLQRYTTRQGRRISARSDRITPD